MQHWWFPESASSYSGNLDHMFIAILYITGAVFVVVELSLIVFLIRYRGRRDRKAAYVEGNNTAEIVWTAIPAVTVILIAVFSQRLWSAIKDRDRIPADATPIRVHVKQFEWQFTMPGPDGRLDTDDDVFRKDTLHVQVDKDYVVNLESQDVIHSFFVPAFRLKQDAVPGMTTHAWFRATRTGSFEIACAELCGVGHYRMPAHLIVHSAEDFARWQASQATPAAPASPPTTSPAETQR
jgi:cytochrome c oxidase subunit 2